MEITQTKDTILRPRTPAKWQDKLRLELPAHDYRSLPIPGFLNAKLGIAYIKVTELPAALDAYMEVNPRVPNRTKKGILAGPVAKGILETLRDTPEEMVLKNQGIYLLVDNANFEHGKLQLSFNDVQKHGIVNGGHTYAAIREAVDNASAVELEQLNLAYVRLHIFEGIDKDFVPEIAEGLNRSKQVDDPSLVNLQGEFEIIRRALKGTKGSDSIAYHQGDKGDIYISELLVYLNLFNVRRFSERKHPNALYNRQALGLKYFIEDMTGHKATTLALIERLPDFLWLADSIRKLTPAAARKNGFRFGALKQVDSNEKPKARKERNVYLPFIAENVQYRVPNGWLYPMLSAFRANLRLEGATLTWRVPIEQLLPQIIDELVGVCVVEHRDNNMRPELIGKRESAYGQCYTKMQLYLAKRNLLY